MGAITRLTERVEALEAEVAALREQVATKAPAVKKAAAKKD